jgi:Oxygen-sensitive ribonucleoside-triphosphate reductase
MSGGSAGRAMSENVSDGDEGGGDAACWLSQVCPECGALLEGPSTSCWRCGARPEEAAARL